MIFKPGLSQSDEFHPAGVTNGAAWYSLKEGVQTKANFSRLLNFMVILKMISLHPTVLHWIHQDQNRILSKVGLPQCLVNVRQR